MSLQYPRALSSDSAPGASLSPRRRQHAIQPPALLTTALPAVQHYGLGLGLNGQTPVSTTSLSSPFSVHQSSPYPASPGGALRGSSPMAARTATFNSPYNPQQWGPLSGHSQNPVSVLATSSRQPRQTPRVAPMAEQPRGPDGILCE